MTEPFCALEAVRGAASVVSSLPPNFTIPQPRPSNTGSLNTARFQHTGTILSSGKVLVAGGLGLLNGNSTWLAQSELYDPVAKTFTNSASLAIARSVHTATLLNSGTVLVAGGIVPGATNS